MRNSRSSRSSGWADRPSLAPKFSARPRAKQCLVLGYRFGGATRHTTCHTRCHTSCHTPVPFGRYDNSMVGGRLVCIPYYLAHGHIVPGSLRSRVLGALCFGGPNPHRYRPWGEGWEVRIRASEPGRFPDGSAKLCEESSQLGDGGLCSNLRASSDGLNLSPRCTPCGDEVLHFMF